MSVLSKFSNTMWFRMFFTLHVFTTGCVHGLPRPEVAHNTTRKPELWAKFKDDNNNLILLDLNKPVESPEKFIKLSLFYVSFHLYTKKNMETDQPLTVNDTEGLAHSYYNKSLETKIIIHGYLNYYKSDSVQSIKNNLLNSTSEGYNVIALDWALASMSLIYQLAVKATQPVGEFLGEFIKFLIREGTDGHEIHLIGHSLGAHVAGFAGNSINNFLLTRITGLDPALPGFDVSDRSKRLDSTDAEFVDCIHTCGGFLGIADPICTSDFYPNMGVNPQPGCPWIDFGSCSHGRSHEFFAESVLPNHVFSALSCDSVYFDPKECVDQGAQMGFLASIRYLGIFYAVTNSEYPFSLNVTRN